jgi:hypothetical protein
VKLASGHIESVSLYGANAGVRPALCDRPGRSLGQRLKLTISAARKLLCNRCRQDALAIAGFADMMSERSDIIRQRWSCRPHRERW